MADAATDPLIKALMDTIPAAGSAWPVDRQVLWLRCMAAAMALVYNTTHDGDTLLIEAVEKTRGLRVVRTVPVARATVRYGDETVRVVIVRDQIGAMVAFVAQGLERDIAAQGNCPGQALRRLAATAATDRAISTRDGIEVACAPPHVFDWYSNAPGESP